jgi:hypothetical protein
VPRSTSRSYLASGVGTSWPKSSRFWKCSTETPRKMLPRSLRERRRAVYAATTPSVAEQHARQNCRSRAVAVPLCCGGGG